MTSSTKYSADIEELSPTIESVDENISAVNDCLQPLLQCPLADMAARVSALQRAKVDLISLFAINSMFWVYLKSRGINPATHGLSKELDRVKSYLQRMKELEDKNLAPHLDKSVTKRVMRNALWSAAHKGTAATADVPDESKPSSVVAKAATGGDRKRTKQPKKSGQDGEKKRKKEKK